MVTRIDRIARSLKDLQDIVYLLKERGVTLRATEQPINTQSAAGKAFLDMLGVFAEFETNLRRERQLEGIAAAKARGVYRGRKPSIDPAEIHRLRVEEKLGATAIARRLGIGRASVYRALASRGGAPLELFLNKKEPSSTAQHRYQWHHPQNALCDCERYGPKYYSASYHQSHAR